jgi:hypothetical protein
VNQERRKRLKEVLDTLEKAKDLLSSVAEEERETFDNMTEGLQATERGQTISDNADTLEDALASLEEIIGNIEAVG